jgi:hypothetical protein
MLGAGIHIGDTLIVDRSIQARSGNVVVAVLNGEFLQVRINGVPGKEIGLSGEPTALFFNVKGKAPVEISACTIRLPGKEVLK